MTRRYTNPCLPSPLQCSWKWSVKIGRCALAQLSDLFADTKRELEDTSKELEETGKKLEETTGNLHVTTGKLRNMTQDRDEQKHLVGVHVNTEHKLHSQATQVFRQLAFPVLLGLMYLDFRHSV